MLDSLEVFLESLNYFVGGTGHSSPGGGEKSQKQELRQLWRAPEAEPGIGLHSSGSSQEG